MGSEIVNITHHEERVFPTTPFGRKLADMCEKKLKDQGAFRRRSEGANDIVIDATYYYSVKEDEEE